MYFWGVVGLGDTVSLGDCHAILGDVLQAPRDGDGIAYGATVGLGDPRTMLGDVLQAPRVGDGDVKLGRTVRVVCDLSFFPVFVDAVKIIACYLL